MSDSTKKLRVKNHLQLPHEVSKKGVTYVFAPDADLPAGFADALLKTYPDRYKEATGKPDLEEYTFKDRFKKSSLQQVFDTLSEENQLRVFEYAKKLALGGDPHEEGEQEESDDPDLESLSIAQLTELAADEEVEIPSEAKKKAEIVAFLKKALEEKKSDS